MNTSCFPALRSAIQTLPSRLFILVATLCCWGILSPAVNAATFQDLLNGGSLDDGNLRFSDWQLTAVALTNGSPPDFALITVDPLANDPLNPGLRFTANGQLALAGVNTLDLLFSFRVSSLDGGVVIGGETLELTGFGVNNGLGFITTEFTDPAASSLATSLVMVDDQTPFLQLSDTMSFAPQSQVVANVNVFTAGLSSTSTTSLDSFTLRFEQIPEPSAVIIASCAIPFAALPLLRRRTG
ncbi:MAG: hypothetical protein SFX18_01775 [Pirellulales bacterium]|nr:hypothetical protein [Pirellulales bacterium]